LITCMPDEVLFVLHPKNICSMISATLSATLCRLHSSRLERKGDRQTMTRHKAREFRSEWAAHSGDRVLIEAVLLGNRAAEREFIERYVRYVRAFASRHGLSPADGDDLCQDVFLRLWEDDKRRLRLWHERRTGVDPESGARGDDNKPFTPFLSVVAAHLLCDRCRAQAAVSRRREAFGIGLEEGTRTRPASPEQALLERTRAAAVRDALDALGGRDADLIARRHLRGESYREIAEGLGMTVNCVGVALGRAERRLRSRMPDLPALA